MERKPSLCWYSLGGYCCREGIKERAKRSYEGVGAENQSDSLGDIKLPPPDTCSSNAVIPFKMSFPLLQTLVLDDTDVRQNA